MHASVMLVLAIGQLMSAEKAASLRAYFPRVDDAKIQAVLSDPNLILYTTQEMPGAYQDWDGALQGIHSIDNNVSADGSEPHGNANQEFPWGDPAGTHRTRGTTAFRFLSLPVQNGRRLPVVWHRKHYPGDRSLGYAWTFPVGATIGEVLLMRGPGRDYPFEVRTRTREHASWRVDAFRPFPTRESLAERIKQLDPQWEQRPQLLAFVRHLLGGALRRTANLIDRHPRVTFRQNALVDDLPPISEPIVAKLLTQTTFRSAVGTSWAENGNLLAAAPTTQSAFHVIPANYDAGFVVVDHESCMRCHDQVGQHVDRFDAGRDWYGRVRGSDGIFSFHPFEMSSLSDNGFSRPVQMRSSLVRAGVIDQYDPARHPKAIYQELRK